MLTPEEKRTEKPNLFQHTACIFWNKNAIYGGEDFEADDDAAATRIARVLYDACSDVCDCFELWQRTRRILEDSPAAPAAAAFSAGSKAAGFCSYRMGGRA